MLFHNARILDLLSSEDYTGYVITSGAYIHDIIRGTDIPSDLTHFHTIVDCKGLLLTPGLIDIQAHMREPGQTQKEDLKSGGNAAVAGGITSIVCQPNTVPRLDNPDILEYLDFKAKMNAKCNIFAYGAVTENLRGEKMTNMEAMAEMNICCGFTDDGLPVSNALIMRHAFEVSKVINLPIAQHAEDHLLSNNGCMTEGIVSAKLGLPGIPNSSESSIVARDIAILEEVGGHYHVLHVSTKEALDMIRAAKAKGLSVTCEVSPHHLLLDESAIEKCGTNAKMNPPLRSNKDMLAMQQGLIDGVFDAIATDHAPHELLSKNCPMENATFGIIGLETLLPLSLEFYHAGKVSLANLFGMLTHRPASVVRLENRGRMQKGYFADLTLIDLNHKWTIDVQKFKSKSKNSPFDGRETKGKAAMTIVNGKIVFVDKEIFNEDNIIMQRIK